MKNEATYQIRTADGQQRTATWRTEGDAGAFVVAGYYPRRVLSRDEVDILQPFSVTAQTLEWYGDGEPNDRGEGGRYKPKGGHEIIVWLTDAEAMYGNVEEVLQEQFMKEGRYYKYDLRGESLMPYTAPTHYYYNKAAGAVAELENL